MSLAASAADARRSMRFWAAAALALLLAATVLQLEEPGPGLVLSGLASIAALWLMLRHPRPVGGSPDRAGRIDATARLVLLAGLAIAVAAFAISRMGEQRARIAALCEGQSAQMGAWKLALRTITPVAGDGYAALQASLAAQQNSAPSLILKPELRSWFIPAPAAEAPSRARLWNGDLALGFADYDAPRDCMALEASWRPFALWVRLGGSLAALGAALMALVALASLRWRSQARARIAMRRESRPLSGSRPVAARKPAILLLAKGLFAGAILGSAALVAMSLTALQPRHAAASLPAFSDGPALQAARQSLRESKTIPSSWIVIADAMARHGQFGDAAKVLLGAVEKEPNNPEAWLALGDALYAHGRGLLSPAAMLAYDRADEATVRGGKPPLLVVAAFERSGRAYLAGNWLQRRANPPPPPSHDIAPAPPCC